MTNMADKPLNVLTSELSMDTVHCPVMYPYPMECLGSKQQETLQKRHVRRGMCVLCLGLFVFMIVLTMYNEHVAKRDTQSRMQDGIGVLGDLWEH